MNKMYGDKSHRCLTVVVVEVGDWHEMADSSVWQGIKSLNRQVIQQLSTQQTD